MKLVIIESPYACDPEEMVKYGRKCLHDSVIRGEAPIASHLLFTQEGVLNDKDKVERSLGIAAGHAWLRVAELVAVYRDFGVSKGMELGIERARSAGVGIEFRDIGQDGLDRYATLYDEGLWDEAADDERARIARALQIEAVRQDWTGWGSAIRWIADRLERNTL